MEEPKRLGCSAITFRACRMSTPYEPIEDLSIPRLVPSWTWFNFPAPPADNALIISHNANVVWSRLLVPTTCAGNSAQKVEVRRRRHCAGEPAQKVEVRRFQSE